MHRFLTYFEGATCPLLSMANGSVPDPFLCGALILKVITLLCESSSLVDLPDMRAGKYARGLRA